MSNVFIVFFFLLFLMVSLILGVLGVRDPVSFMPYIVGWCLLLVFLAPIRIYMLRRFKGKSFRAAFSHTALHFFLCIAVFGAVVGHQIYTSNCRINKFVQLIEGLDIGDDKATVKEMLGGYLINDKWPRIWYFRSMPQAPKTHLNIKDACVRFDDNGLVLSKEVFVPDD